MTVTGPIAPAGMGVTLPHEHILVDFIGAAQASPQRYRADDVIALALPHVRRARELGCETLVDCTPAFIGRDAALLKRLAGLAGVRILTNTGYYGAGGNKFLPAHAFEESAQQLAARWLREWREGIEGTGVRPGFIKIGVDAGPLSEAHRKLVRAAALAHLESGLTIAAHTGNGVAALEELAVLKEAGVAGRAFIWVHAQNETDEELHLRAAAEGAWVEFDGLSAESLDRHLGLAKLMKQHGYLGQVLWSHDAGWYHVGEPGGGAFRPFDTLFTKFLPALRQNGFTEGEIGRMLAGNPSEAFAIRIRQRSG
jgi:phosphotriesterase-related protein